MGRRRKRMTPELSGNSFARRFIFAIERTKKRTIKKTYEKQMKMVSLNRCPEL